MLLLTALGPLDLAVMLPELSILFVKNDVSSLSAHIYEIDTFITEAMKILTVIPQSVEEIGDTNLQYSNLQDRRPEVRIKSNYCHPYFIEMCK